MGADVEASSRAVRYRQLCLHYRRNMGTRMCAARGQRTAERAGHGGYMYDALVNHRGNRSDITLFLVDCAEYARDATNFLLSYLPECTNLAPGLLPTNLPRVPERETLQRKSNGVCGRTIVGIGHSIGACSL